MKKLMKFINITKQEHGIALLFALVMLALLLVMALSFATNSMFSQKISTNNANATGASIMARSTANRLRLMLGFYDAAIIYSHTTSSPTTDMLDHLTTTEDGSYIFEWMDGYENNINWELLTMNDGTDDRIIGRVAYVIIPNGEISPAACVKSGDNENTVSEKRVGVNMYEINLKDLNSTVSGTIIDGTMANDLSYVVDGGDLPVAGSWIDFPTLFSSVSAISDDQKTWFKRWFFIAPEDDDEIFWIDDYADGEIESSTNSTELYHRFNLARVLTVGDNAKYWDDITVAEIIANAKSLNDTITKPTANDGGIPWLFYFGKKWDSGTTTFIDDASVKGNFTAVADRRNQIAANLIDYCDSDSVPTSDQADWTTTTPTYTGNEKTAYLNELVIDVSYTTSTFDNTAAASPNRYDHDATVTVTLSAEIIDIYNLSGNYTVTVYGSRRVEHVTIGGTVALSDTGVVAFSPNPLSSGVIADAALKGYTVIDGFPVGNEAVDYDSSASGGTVSNDTLSVTTDFGAVHITIDKIILNDGTNNVDIANFNSFTITVPAYSINGVGQYYVSQSLSVKDPRQNLNAGGADLDWKNNIAQGNDTGSQVNARSAANATLGASNYQCTPSYAYTADATNTDKETGTHLAVSTAYIRNAPMLSPWEIGFINRGAPYQTINLTAFDDRFALTYKNNGALADGDVIGGYAVGDANILDQIKMNAELANPMKINLKTHRDEVLYALLNNIRVGSSQSDPGNTSSGIPVTVGNIPTVIDAIKSNSLDWLTRAQVASLTELTDGTTLGLQPDNATQEEIIGKFINLTKFGSKHEYYTMVIVSQSIQDIGGSGVDIDIVKKDSSDTNQTISAQLGRFDYTEISAPSGVTDGKFNDGEYLYADKITGEQKIVVRLKRNLATEEISILDFQYMQ